MFGRLRRFINRHIGKVFIGVVAIPAFIRLTSIVANRYLEYQTERTRMLLRKFKKQQMFELMEENLGPSFAQWYGVMKESIKKELDVGRYKDRLKNNVGDKVDNWNALKVMAFANVMALVYGSSMLIVLLRIQVNVCSGLLFKQMDEDCDPPGLDLTELGGAGDASISRFPKKITEELQQDYMILTRYLCTEGISRFCRMFHEKCENVIGRLSLKKKVTISELEQIFSNIRDHKLDDQCEVIINERFRDAREVQDWCPVSQAWQYMFSEAMKQRFLYFPEAYARQVDEHEAYLRTLVGEAFDLVNGDDTKNILKFLEAQGISHHLDMLSDSFRCDGWGTETSESSAHSESTLDREITAPIAKIIPTMNAFVDIAFADDTWAQLLLQNPTLKTFSANVYESYSSQDFNHISYA